VLNGGGGVDRLVGLGGDDQYYLADGLANVIEAAGGGSDAVYTAVSHGLRAGQEIERLHVWVASSTQAINLVGNEFGQVIAGNAGANILVGGGGADTLVGRGGDDIYRVSDSRAFVYEIAGEGTDIVYTSVSFRTDHAVEYLLAEDAASTAAINLVGGAFAQTIAGNAGANIIDGGTGADTLVGRGGDDSYIVRDGLANVHESAGEGSDIVYAAASYRLRDGQSLEFLLAHDAASTADLNLVGNALAQVIAGNAGANIIDGAGGADTLVGRGGNDTYLVRDAGTFVYETAGEGSDVIYTAVSYALTSDSSIEFLLADNAAATTALNLAGNEHAQLIAGNEGANTIAGGGGADTLVGRGGEDGFAFTAPLGNGNVDWIYDFNVAADTVLLDDAVFAGLTPGALAAGAFVTGSAAADADDRVIYDAAAGSLLFDADGSGAGAAVLFATLDAGLALTAGDFLVV
jgi:Ca2+-binding RTX toxin-like protein